MGWPGSPSAGPAGSLTWMRSAEGELAAGLRGEVWTSLAMRSLREAGFLSMQFWSSMPRRQGCSGPGLGSPTMSLLPPSVGLSKSQAPQTQGMGKWTPLLDRRIVFSLGLQWVPPEEVNSIIQKDVRSIVISTNNSD